jgi:hypothetical protein
MLQHASVLDNNKSVSLVMNWSGRLLCFRTIYNFMTSLLSWIASCCVRDMGLYLRLQLRKYELLRRPRSSRLAGTFSAGLTKKTLLSLNIWDWHHESPSCNKRIDWKTSMMSSTDGTTIRVESLRTCYEGSVPSVKPVYLQRLYRRVVYCHAPLKLSRLHYISKESWDGLLAMRAENLNYRITWCHIHQD